MTTTPLDDPLAAIRAVNASAAFNRWAGFEVLDAGDGRAELRLPWREELGQYAGFAHAGVVAALVDTACGFAAATRVGPVVASQCAVRYLAPAAGDAFVATATVVRAGRRQVFTAAELHAEQGGERRLVAVGDTVLVPVAADA
jgi:uncharacterized protein (TIGR00369 family)